MVHIHVHNCEYAHLCCVLLIFQGAVCFNLLLNPLLPSRYAHNCAVHTHIHNRAHLCCVLLILQGAVCFNSLLNPLLPSRNQLLPCTSPQSHAVAPPLHPTQYSIPHPSLWTFFARFLQFINSGSMSWTRRNKYALGFRYVCIMPNQLHIELLFSSIWLPAAWARK